MRYWKRTIPIGIAVLMLLSAVLTISDADSAPTRANPVLSNGYVAPTNGYTDTLFNFTVRYTDTDGDAPLYVSVVVGNIHHNMTEVNVGNGSYAAGKDLFFKTCLSAGTVNYYFMTENVLRETARFPSTGTYSLYVQTRSTGVHLYNASYTPVRPYTTAPVNFTVGYRHSNGTAPSFIRVNITTGNQTTYLYMHPIGTNFTNGVTYFGNIYLGQGYHHYRYEAYLSPNVTVFLPASSVYWIYIYPTSSNSYPVLSSPGVSPHNPDRGQNTTFWVTYSDLDYDIPYLFYLRYYREDDRENISTVDVNLGSGNISQGVNCTKVLQFWENGTYYYFFSVFDRSGGSDFTDHYPFHVGDVPQPPRNPRIYDGTHSPSQPTIQDTINFTVKYLDESGLSLPDFVKLHIRNETSGFVNYTLSPDHTNASTVVHYSYLTLLAVGSYHYYFEAKIGNISSRSPTSGY
ncbi:MAG: hypothetical protein ACMUFK_05210, partial [Thermoplasmatota archaeon]